VPFPDGLLTDDEHVTLHQRPHPKRLLRPAVTLLIIVVVAGYAATLTAAQPWAATAQGAISIIAAALALAFVAAPALRWLCTHLVLTTERVLTRRGFLTRRGEAIPIGRIVSVNWKAGLTDRAFHCGTLIIESASAQTLIFTDIPNIQHVHTLLYRQVNQHTPHGPPAWR
jgi:membrane protein YdbS with pleckstrin-like domain